MSTKILTIDDDRNICEAIKLYLENEGYDVATANDGAAGISTFKSYDPDLVLLDIMMPQKDGWQVCREIREISSKPIIMLSAKGEVIDRVVGLELGADDYMEKPFDMKELLARIRVVLRRCQNNKSSNEEKTVKFDKIEISLDKYVLILDGQSLDIPPKELELLYFLASNSLISSNQLSSSI